MTDQTFDSTFAAQDATKIRALQPTAAFWLAMFVASALGTNIGDFWAEELGLGLPTSFASLAILCAVLIWGDRENGIRTEIFYWLAIVCLRAVATNVGDFLTHNVGLNYLLAAIVIGALTLALGCFTRPALGGASPRIDLRYWAAMFAGGVFGTIGGDLTAHTIGLFLAAVLLGVLLLAVIRVRNLAAPTAVVGYWCVVLAERAAGTPMGDWLAKARGLNLGLPVSMIVVTLALLAALAWRSRDQFGQRSGTAPLAFASILLPTLRLGLLALSVIGSLFMLRIYITEHPANPALVLTYGIGLAFNAFYLAMQEFAGTGSSRTGRVILLWLAAQQSGWNNWLDNKEAELRKRLG